MDNKYETQTNVDYLLQKLTISEIIDIQNKLKTDVDRKKEELKQLVGERYGDLIEAVDTIKQMNDSVDYVLKSLVSLNKSQSKHFFTSNKTSLNGINGTDGQYMDTNVNAIKRYKSGLILKLLIEMPLNIWSALESQDLLSATYNYFYGQHLCSLFRQSVPATEIPNLFKEYEFAIKRFSEVIVNKCWDFHKRSSLIDTFDESTNADIFCCLLLLQDLTPKQLFVSVLEKRKYDIKECFESSYELKQCLQYFINLLFNTIKCIHSIFFRSNGTKSKILLNQRYERMTKTSFESTLLKDRKLSKELSSGLTNFKINKSFIDVIEPQFIRTETKEWIESIKTSIEPLLEQMLESIDSSNYICIVLNEINSYLKQTQKLIDWEEYCEELMANYFPIWDQFIISFVIRKNKEIISENISKTLNSLTFNIQNSIIDNNSLKSEDLEVIHYIWNESEINGLSLSKRTFGQIPAIDVFCADFDNSLLFLLNDIKMLKDFKLIKSNELEDIETHLVIVCHSMAAQLKHFLQSIDSSESIEITLFCAQLLRQITQSSPHLKQCFDISSNVNQYSWTKTKDLFLSYSYNSYKKVFDYKINHLFRDISSESLTDLNEFITNCLVWDKIQTTEETEDGKAITSKISVPLQMSAFLHNNLSQLCNEVNRVVGHTIPRLVALNILSTLTEQLVRIYGTAYECLSDKDYPQNIKQTISLQIYFDLLFVKQLLGTTREESIKANQMNKIHDLIQKFEIFVDPFDLHVFYPHIQTNVAKLARNTSVIFGLLVPDSPSLISDSKSKVNNQTNEVHNIMTYHSCQKPFTLFNVNSITTKVIKK